jgi:plastocyanin
MNSSRGRKLLGTLGLLVLLIYVAGVFTAGYAAGTTVAASARPASGSMSASARAGKTSAAPSVTSTASAAATAGAATPSPTPPAAPAPGLPVSAAAPGTLTISMLTRGSAFGYAPASASIPAGTTVRWVNASSAPHTVTGFGVDSGIIPVGGQFTYTFSRPGTYTYSCMLHPGMTGVIVVYAATAGRPVPPPPPVPTPQPAPILPPPPPPAPGVAAVTMTQGADFAFSPATLTVPLGTTVRWTNATSAPHTVTAAGFDSGTIPSGGTYSHTFTQAGAFSYHCAFHPNMTGTIIVSGTATPPPSATPPPTSAAAQVQLIKNDGDYSFAPAALSIKVGTVVTWLNTTGDTLTVDGASFHSAPMAREGGTWSHLFTTPGTYTYSSSLRPEMSGTIIVSA